ncbi:MAG: HTTM domain-containing protein, partial [Siphonobacter sp.]
MKPVTDQILFKEIDNGSLLVFRVVWGVLMTIECWGGLLTGWVRNTFLLPKYTFTFIGFEWTEHLLGTPIYFLYFLLGLMGVLIAIGLNYRIATIVFAIGWTLTYLMQKIHYNNHFYLLVLISWMMVFLPANTDQSYDVRFEPEIRSSSMPNWIRLLFMFQVSVMYFFAAVAKLYPGWMSGDFLSLRFIHTANWLEYQIGLKGLAEFFREKWFAATIARLGFLFDLLIVPLLLLRHTRKVALFALLIFHLFNSLSLNIGVFPYVALALTVFFFPPETIRNQFFATHPKYTNANQSTQYKTLITTILVVYSVWQLYLPLRHWLIPGEVLWTEEGHRMSWRMMLRSRQGTIDYF